MEDIRTFRKGDLQNVKEVLRESFFVKGKDEVYNEWEFAEQILLDKGFREKSIWCFIMFCTFSGLFMFLKFVAQCTSYPFAFIKSKSFFKKLKNPHTVATIRIFFFSINCSNPNSTYKNFPVLTFKCWSAF